MNRKERRALERQKISSFDGEVKKEEYKPKKNYTRYVIISLVIIIFIGAIFVSYLKGKKWEANFIFVNSPKNFLTK